MITHSLIPSSLAFIEGVGGPELLMIMVIVLILFGGKKLPEFARGLGNSIREIKKATSGVEEEFKRAMDDEPERPRVTAPQTTVPQTTASAPAKNSPSAASEPTGKPAANPKPADDSPRA